MNSNINYLIINLQKIKHIASNDVTCYLLYDLSVIVFLLKIIYNNQNSGKKYVFNIVTEIIYNEV